MSIPKITEIIVEPIKIYTDTKFNIKVKIESEYLLQKKFIKFLQIILLSSLKIILLMDCPYYFTEIKMNKLNFFSKYWTIPR